MSIQKKAKRLYDGFEYIKIDDDEENTRLVLKGSPNDKLWKELSSLMFEINEKTQLSQDSTYCFTHEALGVITDSDEESSEDDLREIASEQMEADVYTSGLTEWLNESNSHVYYLTQVLEEFDLKDGFQVLGMAQHEAKLEVYNMVLDYLYKS